MDNFKKFCEIYCDNSYQLKEEVFIVQKYPSKSAISYFNYIIKQKIIEKIYIYFKFKEQTPPHLLKAFKSKKFKSEQLDKILKKNKNLKKILEKIENQFSLNNYSYTHVLEELEDLNQDEFINKNYNIYFDTVNKVKRTREEVNNFIKINNVYLGIFYILLWGNHKEPHITNVLFDFEKNDKLIDEISTMLFKSTKSPEETYDKLNAIRGLGPAYFTKILYFYTHAFSDVWKDKMYIMDQFTSKSMNLLRKSLKNHNINLSDESIKILKNNSLAAKYSTYKKFNDDIKSLTNFFKNEGNSKINEELIEVMLFGQNYTSKTLNFSPHELWRKYVNENYDAEFNIIKSNFFI